MNKVNELIQKLCPDGVEYKTLGDIAINYDRKRKAVTKGKRKAGIYPYYGASGIVDYVSDYIFDGDYLLVSEDGANLLARNTPIAFSISGKNWVNNHAHVLGFETKETQKYVEIYLNSIDLGKYISGAAQPKLNQENLNKVIIPVPPLAIQEEIVKILDKLTETINELKAAYEQFKEIKKAKFEHYRDKLLTFGDDVEYVKLGESCLLKAGKNITAANISKAQDEIYKYPCYGGNGIRGYVKTKSHEGYYPIIGRQGALCGNVCYVNGEFYVTEHAVVVKDNGYYNHKFLYYLLDFAELNKYKTAGAQPGLSVTTLNRISFPVPPLAEQERIVEILDRFTKTYEELMDSISKTIEVKEKEFEYYRDELLNFKDISAI